MKYYELRDKYIKLSKEITELKEQYSRDSHIVWKAKREFRHLHIAASELRGKSREQIEKPTRAFPVDEDYIKKIKDSIEPREALNEDVCSDS